MSKRRWFNPVLFLMARSDLDDLAQQIQFLKAENQILRAKLPKRVHVTPAEKTKLLKFARPVGRAVQALVSIVSPRTIARWMIAGKSIALRVAPRKRGRPRTKEEIRELVLKIARETGWGYTRIVGELKKLGIQLAPNTVRTILKEEGYVPSPGQGEKNWQQFVRMHTQSLWACDFFVKKVWSGFRLRTCYVLFFIHLGTRRVHLAGASIHPDAGWMVDQAERFSQEVATQTAPESVMLFRDRDSKFTREFDTKLEERGIKVAKLTPQSPNLNPYAEVWIRSIKRECLDDFICFGQEHLAYVVNEYVQFYNTVRPHQGIGNVTIGKAPPQQSSMTGYLTAVVCQSRLGGLLRHYTRTAA